MKKKIDNKSDNKITRKQAIKKAGITALTTTSLLFLETKAKAQGSSDTNSNPAGLSDRGRTGSSSPFTGESNDVQTLSKPETAKTNRGKSKNR